MKYCIALFMTLASCGGLPTPQDGKDGASGTSPKCEVVKKDDGKTYLRCSNPDGSAAEAEIAGSASEEVPEAKLVAQCSHKSELYSTHYNVLAVGTDLRIASLSVVHLKTPKVYYQGSVLHALGDENYAAAEIKLSAFSAKLVGEKKANLYRVGVDAGEAMSCK